jgi:hypothetical protein
MSCLGTALIFVVVLQNSMDLLKDELGSCTETCVTSTVDGNEVTDVEGKRVCVIKKEDQEPMTIPVIKTEPEVSCVPVVSVCTFLIGYMQNCLILYQCVLMEQKFGSREWILSSF